MKKIVFLLALLINYATTNAQDIQWHTDIKKAIEVSNKEKKPLFLFFTGSDWCGWCIRLQKEVFKTSEFMAWAKDNVVLVDLDFPRRTPQSDELKQQNAQLQQVFNIQGFPTVWFVKPTQKDGKTNFEPLGSSGYLAGGPSVWIANAQTFTSKYVADAGTTSAKSDVTPVKSTPKIRKKAAVKKA
jgi:protein disulfide-isomerase